MFNTKTHAINDENIRSFKSFHEIHNNIESIDIQELYAQIQSHPFIEGCDEVQLLTVGQQDSYPLSYLIDTLMLARAKCRSEKGTSIIIGILYVGSQKTLAIISGGVDILEKLEMTEA